MVEILAILDEIETEGHSDFQTTGRLLLDQDRRSKTVFIMIMILLAFVIGAGIGVMLSFDKGTEDANNETHVENVTVEMTTNVNHTDEVTYDEADAVDYNENQTDLILPDENRVYYDPYEDIQQ